MSLSRIRGVSDLERSEGERESRGEILGSLATKDLYAE